MSFRNLFNAIIQSDQLFVEYPLILGRDVGRASNCCVWEHAIFYGSVKRALDRKGGTVNYLVYLE